MIQTCRVNVIAESELVLLRLNLLNNCTCRNLFFIFICNLINLTPLMLPAPRHVRNVSVVFFKEQSPFVLDVLKLRALWILVQSVFIYQGSLLIIVVLIVFVLVAGMLTITR